MSVVRHILYGSFVTQNTMVAFIFSFDPRKGQRKVKISQKRSTDQTFLLKTCLYCPVLSQNSKNVIFYVRQFKMPKIALKKVTSSTLPVFYHCTAKNKDVDLKFGMYVFCM